ncbi:MAG: hypothetical protein CVV64_08350 [Candidatus Wallbacteria bacterium HGW-Wallbacteria-1]|jgi:hypothetical protein|uniref:Uncharacterized protein n=1 Tax=Candidatus Wallbacteria bacterium HGW-Wallbacteria-1 TaxID=2013854 RepID=A0A2N1PRC1_9BACT|nr:MAG: hypothetical protein CVV64_08350 [Candidatus Wallbacteria bacterium HGW-Wallbacteria-1]
MSMTKKITGFLTFLMILSLIAGSASAASNSIKTMGTSMVVTSQAPIINKAVNQFRNALFLKRNGASKVYPLFAESSGKLICALQLSGDPSTLMAIARVEARFKDETNCHLLQFIFKSAGNGVINNHNLIGVTAIIDSQNWGPGLVLEGPIMAEGYQTDGVNSLIDYELMNEKNFFNMVPGYLFEQQQKNFFLVSGPEKYVRATSAVLLRTKRSGDKNITMLIPTFSSGKMPESHLGLISGIYCGQSKYIGSGRRAEQNNSINATPISGHYISKGVPDYQVTISEFPYGRLQKKGLKEVERQNNRNVQTYQVNEPRFYEVDHYKWWHDDTDRFEY